MVDSASLSCPCSGGAGLLQHYSTVDDICVSGNDPFVEHLDDHTPFIPPVIKDGFYGSMLLSIYLSTYLSNYLSIKPLFLFAGQIRILEPGICIPDGLSSKVVLF